MAKNSSFSIWFAEAWEGWIRPLGLIILCGLFYLLYRFDIIGERTAGVLAVAVVVLGTLAGGVLPALGLAQKPWQRALLWTTAGLWLVATGYPSLHAALPGKVLAQATLTAATPSTTLSATQPGPYEIAVSGRFKDEGRSEVDVDYTLHAKGADGSSDDVSGSIQRHLATFRAGRRGGMSTKVQEHTESTHALPHVRTAPVTVTADGVDEELEGGLSLALRAGGWPPLPFIILGALGLVLALLLDSQLTDGRKARAYLTALMAIAFVFSLRFPEEATPHAIVRPAVSAFLLALLIGGLGGWLASSIGRFLFGPKPAKATTKDKRSATRR